ncbi:MAG TPA: response regulator transcription factor [Candidatus Acidoferrales bacterium]
MIEFSGHQAPASFGVANSFLFHPVYDLQSEIPSNSAFDSASSGDDSSPAGRKRFKILIADDHEAVRRGLRSAVVAAGWELCGEAVHGQDAVEKVQALKPDLIILDLSMPVMNGLDAAREIRKKAPGVKIVGFTMHESAQVREQTTMIGFHALAAKSAPLGNLLATVRSILESA